MPAKFAPYTQTVHQDWDRIHTDMSTGYGHPCAYYSKHEFARIPMAAVHTNTSTLWVWFSLVQVFLRGSCF